MPKIYRLIVSNVEAIEVTPDSVQRAAVWCGGRIASEIHPFDNTVRYVAINIPTLEGVKRASEGDFIIKSDDGSFDVMGGNAFRRKYEPVS